MNDVLLILLFCLKNRHSAWLLSYYWVTWYNSPNLDDWINCQSSVIKFWFLPLYTKSPFALNLFDNSVYRHHLFWQRFIAHGIKVSKMCAKVCVPTNTPASGSGRMRARVCRRRRRIDRCISLCRQLPYRQQHNSIFIIQRLRRHHIQSGFIHTRCVCCYFCCCRSSSKHADGPPRSRPCQGHVYVGGLSRVLQDAIWRRRYAFCRRRYFADYDLRRQRSPGATYGEDLWRISWRQRTFPLCSLFHCPEAFDTCMHIFLSVLCSLSFCQHGSSLALILGVNFNRFAGAAILMHLRVMGQTFFITFKEWTSRENIQLECERVNAQIWNETQKWNSEQQERTYSFVKVWQSQSQ